jgi:hypothetical protein
MQQVAEAKKKNESWQAQVEKVEMDQHLAHICP